MLVDSRLFTVTNQFWVKNNESQFNNITNIKRKQWTEKEDSLHFSNDATSNRKVLTTFQRKQRFSFLESIQLPSPQKIYGNFCKILPPIFQSLFNNRHGDIFGKTWILNCTFPKSKLFFYIFTVFCIRYVSNNHNRCLFKRQKKKNLFAFRRLCWHFIHRDLGMAKYRPWLRT
jgi:hypothetical protein